MKWYVTMAVMGMYALIASVLLYAVMVRVFGRFNLSVIFCGIVVAGGILILNVLGKWILSSNSGISIFEVINIIDIVVFALQLITAIGIFYKIRQSEESITAWLAWAAVGVVALFVVAPYISLKLVSIL